VQIAHYLIQPSPEFGYISRIKLAGPEGLLIHMTTDVVAKKRRGIKGRPSQFHSEWIGMGFVQVRSRLAASKRCRVVAIAHGSRVTRSRSFV
jgi:hypothetical protein